MKPCRRLLLGFTALLAVAACTGATHPTNPLFNVIRTVQVPTGATGMLYANGALYTWSDEGPQATNLVTRIDTSTGQSTATARETADGAAFAGDLLWLPAVGHVIALDPVTLRVVHDVPVPTTTNGRIAAAGRLIWVAGRASFYAIDPATAKVVRTVATPSPPPFDGYSFAPGDYQIDLGAPPDGSALWTAESPGGGGYDGLQVRDPVTGAVVNSSTDSVASVGDTQIAAADGFAWLAYRTGMSGSYLRIRNQPGLPATAPSDPVAGTDATSVYLAAGRLWVDDPQTGHTGCVDPANGHPLETANVRLGATVPLPKGLIAVLSMSDTAGATVTIARPAPACRPVTVTSLPEPS